MIPPTTKLIKENKLSTTSDCGAGAAAAYFVIIFLVFALICEFLKTYASDEKESN